MAAQRGLPPELRHAPEALYPAIRPQCSPLILLRCSRLAEYAIRTLGGVGGPPPRGGGPIPITIFPDSLIVQQVFNWHFPEILQIKLTQKLRKHIHRDALFIRALGLQPVLIPHDFSPGERNESALFDEGEKVLHSLVRFLVEYHCQERQRDETRSTYEKKE